MAIPTQATSGTEVLRRTGLSALTNSWTSIKFDGTMSTASSGSNHQDYTVPANHIIIVTSDIFGCVIFIYILKLSFKLLLLLEFWNVPMAPKNENQSHQDISIFYLVNNKQMLI